MRHNALHILLVAFLAALSAGATESDTCKCKTRVPLLERPFFTEGIIGRAIRAFSDSDTAYVEYSHYNWSTMASADAQVQHYAISTPDGFLRTGPGSTISVAPHFGWRWLVYGYSFNVWGGDNKLKTQHLSFYTRPLGVDLCYQKNSGNFYDRRPESALPDGGPPPLAHFRSKLITAHAFYIFNHFKFSYSAALTQGAPQRRSAGSWLLGLRYDHQNAEMDTHIFYHNIGLSTGYAYNWVFARNWLLGAGLQPGAGSTLWRENNAEGPLRTRAFNATLVGRVGLVWTDGTYFAGASAITHNYFFFRSATSFTNSLNYFSIYAGVKFGLRKKYKKRD